MKFRRDPRDRRYPERLTGSFLASLLIHALFAALLFTVLVSSSEQGANENLQGGEVVTVSRTSPVVVANQPAATHAAVPVPHVRVIAPLQHAPLAVPQTQRQPTNRHELAKTAPSAPPNPQPIPQTTPQPNPEPTQNIFRDKAVQRSSGSSDQRADGRAGSGRREAASDHGSVAFTLDRAGRASVAASARADRPPERQAGDSGPGAAEGVAKPGGRRPRQHRSRSAGCRAQAQRAPRPLRTRLGRHRSRRRAAPPPRPDHAKAPGRRVRTPRTVRSPCGPTASPGPRPTAAPKKQQNAPNINAKLRSLLPNNPVHPSVGTYTPSYSLRGRLEPTPPPDVLAKTQYMYEVKGIGSEERR